jgi:hypothetical protein
LHVIADRPGVTIAELTSATGIAKTVLYSLTRSLTERGQIERVTLPGDTYGFRIAQPTDQAHAEGQSETHLAGPGARVTRARRTRTSRPDAAEADTDAEQPAEETEASTEPAPI